MSRAWTALRLAFAFLTVFPIPWPETKEVAEADLAASRYAYPVVGLLIGLLLVAINEALVWAGATNLIAAFLLLAASVAITGALHLDGAADSADGLFLNAQPERRLDVMRDPHLGTFGTLAIGLLLLGKFAALASLSGHARSRALVAAAAMSRTLVLVCAGTASYARPSGTGKVLVSATTELDAGAAAVIACVVGLVCAGGVGLGVGLASVTLAFLFTQWAAARLNGITGDILGGVVELEDLVILTSLGLTRSLWAF